MFFWEHTLFSRKFSASILPALRNSKVTETISYVNFPVITELHSLDEVNGLLIFAKSSLDSPEALLVHQKRLGRVLQLGELEQRRRTGNLGRSNGRKYSSRSKSVDFSLYLHLMFSG